MGFRVESSLDTPEVGLERRVLHCKLQKSQAAAPNDPLCLTDFHLFPLTENPKEWSNNMATLNYPFEALVQHGPSAIKHPRKPVYGPCYDTLHAGIRWLKDLVMPSQTEPFGKPEE